MSDKPATATLPRWANSGGDVVEPPSGKKDIGWIDDEEPPAEYLNWLLFEGYTWLEWIDERVYDEYTEVSKSSDCLLYGDPDEGMTVRDAAGNYLPVMAGDLTGDYYEQLINLDSLPTAMAAMVDRCSAECTTPAALSSDTPTEVTFDTTSGAFDESVGGIIVVPDTDFIIQHDGTWRIDATADLNGAIGLDEKLSIVATRTSGTFVTTATLAKQATTSATGAGHVCLCATATGRFVAGDVITIVVESASGVGSIYSARCSVTQISGATPAWA